jgi:hypothetical protein
MHSFIHQWHYSPLLGPRLFFSFVISFIHTVEHLERVISPSQSLYLHTGQHKHNKCIQTSILWVGFEPTIPAFERAKTVDSLRPRGDCDRLHTWEYITYIQVTLILIKSSSNIFMRHSKMVSESRRRCYRRLQCGPLGICSFNPYTMLTTSLLQLLLQQNKCTVLQGINKGCGMLASKT